MRNVTVPLGSSIDCTKKTWFFFTNGKRQQSGGEIAFKVNAGGRTGDCKINCLNATGVPNLLSVLVANVSCSCANNLRCDSMTVCSRILRHWYVNGLFNDATAWTDSEMSCDLT